MKIEAGKQYRTRSGDLVRIYATDGAGLYSVHGALFDGDGWEPDHWTLQGGYGPKGGTSVLDITREEAVAPLEEK